VLDGWPPEVSEASGTPRSAPESPQVVRFEGVVSCRRDQGPLGLTLIGRTSDWPDELATLAFATAVPPDMPEALEDPSVERLDAGRVRISAGDRDWIVAARSLHLHREVATNFYRAVEPRAVPWQKRLFWRFVLALVARPAGRRLLLALRKR